MSAETLLETHGLAVARGERRVVSDVSLRLEAGEAVALVGPNAAGKSTLLRACAGLLPAAAGEVRLLRRPLAAWSRDAVARTLALVTTDEDVPPPLTVEDRVALGRYPHLGPFRQPREADRRAVSRALEQTGIAHLGARPLATLSAGERQLAALARGLAQEPRVLLLDEPGAHLDVGHLLRLFGVLDEIRGCGVAVLAVVHDLQRAADWCGRMLLLANGGIAAAGTPDAVLRGEACARAFDVRILGHSLPGAKTAYRFEPPRPEPAAAASPGSVTAPGEPASE